ncbi:hypothetical protein OROMI_009502 [Orobanche minor]
MLRLMHGPKTLIQHVKKQPSLLMGGSCIVLGKLKPDLDMCKLDASLSERVLVV